MNTPEGWKLVPITPTDDMEAAAEDDYEETGATFPNWKSAYHAMLAVVPEPHSPYHQAKEHVMHDHRTQVIEADPNAPKLPPTQQQAIDLIDQHVSHFSGGAKYSRRLTPAEKLIVRGFVNQLFSHE